MPMSELHQWAQYHAIEPFGPYFDDLRTAQIVAAIYNVNRDTKAHPDPISPSALVPWNALHARAAAPAQPVQMKTPEELEAAIVAMVQKASQK